MDDTEAIDVPQPATFPEGGTVGGVRCVRCGEPASRSYEGVEPLDFCEGCFRDFGEWITPNIDAETDRSEGRR